MNLYSEPRQSNGPSLVLLGFLGVCIWLVVVVALVYMSPARAQDKPVIVGDPLYTEDRLGNSMRLDHTPCVNGKVLMLAERNGIPKSYLEAMQAGLMFYAGKHYDACWVLGPDGAVYVVDDAGDMSRIPMAVFKRRNGA